MAKGSERIPGSSGHLQEHGPQTYSNKIQVVQREPRVCGVFHEGLTGRRIRAGRQTKNGAAAPARNAQRQAQASAHRASPTNMMAQLGRSVVDPPVSGLSSVRPLVDRMCAARRAARAIATECNTNRSVDSHNKEAAFGRQMVRTGQGRLKDKWNECTWVRKATGWMECVDRLGTGMEM